MWMKSWRAATSSHLLCKKNNNPMIAQLFPKMLMSYFPHSSDKPHAYSDLTLLAVLGNCIIHTHKRLYYSWVMILLFILQLIHVLFMYQPRLLSPAESGGHSWEFGGWAGCSSGGHRSPKVAPPLGQYRKDSCGYSGRSRAEGPALTQPDIHGGGTLECSLKD